MVTNVTQNLRTRVANRKRVVAIAKKELSLQRKIVTIRMEPPSQVISNQIAGVGSDDPLSRLCTYINSGPVASEAFGRLAM